MKTIAVWGVLLLVVVTALATGTEAKEENPVLHNLLKRSPGRHSRERHGGRYEGYGMMNYGRHDPGYQGYGYGGYSHGGHSHGHGGHSHGHGGHSHGGRSRGGRSRGRHGGRSRRRYAWGGSSSSSSSSSDSDSDSDSDESRGYGGFVHVATCRCPFAASGRWGSGGVGDIGTVETGDATERDNSLQDSGYYRQWYRAFATHPCCAGREGAITSFQRTQTRGYRTGFQ